MTDATEAAMNDAVARLNALMAAEARDASRIEGMAADASSGLWPQFCDAQERQEATGRPVDLVWEDYEQAAQGTQMAVDLDDGDHNWTVTAASHHDADTL